MTDRLLPKALVSLLSLCLLALAGTGCSTVKVTAEHEAGRSFAKLKTYAWFPDEERPPGTHDFTRPQVARAIRAAIERELGDRGFTQVDRAQADVLVAFRGNAENEFSRAVRQSTDGTRDYDYFHVRGRRPSQDVRARGTLIIALIDDEAKRAIWKGIAVGMLKEQPVRPSRVNEVVSLIMEQYPPAGDRAAGY